MPSEKPGYHNYPHIYLFDWSFSMWTVSPHCRTPSPCMEFILSSEALTNRAGLPWCSGGLLAQRGLWDPSESTGSPRMLMTDPPSPTLVAVPPRTLGECLPCSVPPTASSRAELFKKEREGRGMVLKRNKGSRKRILIFFNLISPFTTVYLLLPLMHHVGPLKSMYLELLRFPLL